MANPSPCPLPDKPPVRSVDSARMPQDDASQNPLSTRSLSGTISPLGPRKLIRPTLPTRVLSGLARRNASPILAHHEAMTAMQNYHESSHAEAFYFQKQAHTQTLMVVVLESGEKIEGYIEWYDRNSIKMKNHTRTLIYKSSIKYLYKANETDGI